MPYKSNREADLSGFLLNGMDPETGDIHAGTKGVQISEEVRRLLKRRPQSGVAQRSGAPTGREAAGTFVNGEAFVVKPKTRCHFSTVAA